MTIIKPTPQSCLIFISAIACTICFVAMMKSQWEVYKSEPTGTSLQWKSVKNIPFPAISVCDPHFENRRMLEDFKAPVLPFQTPRKIVADPLLIYTRLEVGNLPTMPNLWKYYFTLDKMFPFQLYLNALKLAYYSWHDCISITYVYPLYQ